MIGQVFWITGLSGAGKTTIGTRLFYRLKKKDSHVVLLDGDVIKDLFSVEEVDYSKEGRLKRGFQYSELCKLLAYQGITVICCTIAMFDAIRAWNRLNLPNYFEVFIDTDIDIVRKRDVKGLYQQYNTGSDAMVGLSDYAELPKNPDLVIKNNFDDKIDLHIETILSNIEQINDSKIEYWNSYYRSDITPKSPSDFAMFITSYLKPEKKLIDLGCGNGRDSMYFCNIGLKVTAVDSSPEAISLIDESLPIFTVCDDFVAAKALFCVDYDYCYLRWSIHAINQKQQDDLLPNIYNALNKNGILFIEARTTNDSKFGVGKYLGQNEYFFDNHYTRFIDVNELSEQLASTGFKLIYCKEFRDFANMNENSPTMVRLIAQKE